VLRAQALRRAGLLAWEQGDTAKAQQLLGECLDINLRNENAPGIASTLETLARVERTRGNYAQAGAYAEESLRLRRELHNEFDLAFSLHELGIIMFELGDLARAHLLHTECLALRQQIGDISGAGFTLNALGNIARIRGEFLLARQFLEQSIAHARMLLNKRLLVIAHNNLALVAVAQCHPAGAKAVLMENLELCQAMDHKEFLAWTLEGFAAMASAMGKSLEAAQLWGAVVALRESIAAPLPPVDQAYYKRTVLAALREQMGEPAFNAAVIGGKSLSLDQAIAMARAATA
jgi:tetratricopeptide (TPR) repeat protein